MSGSRNDWFPTPIWLFKVDNYEQLNQELLKAIYDEKKRDTPEESLRDRKGKQWSNILGWHSIDTLHQLTIFQSLSDIIYNNVIEVGTFLNWDLDKFKINISTCWAIINQKYAYNSIHNHPNSLLSGVYFLKTPLSCGGIYFSDPRPATQMIVPPVKDFNMWTLPKITYKPYEGMMLLFPSWLSHGVETNLSEEDRVCINFNLAMKPV
ncbi:MAG: hypothetical protein HC903_22915 [Methylacidiphilales bacterium]|nr:hypothetical protein [Candidatus Methylacidiphilales bacterium]NJR18331.1 hypothetical protein [Calothrix sp. CSU_2_0]